MPMKNPPHPGNLARSSRLSPEMARSLTLQKGSYIGRPTYKLGGILFEQPRRRNRTCRRNKVSLVSIRQRLPL